jgi:hypothetical protein
MPITDHPTTLAVLILCHHGPPAVHAGEPTEFGLQDKRLRLDAGQPDGDGVRRFSVALTVQPRGAAGAPDYAGAAVHGPPGGRFLYLGWRVAGAPGWIRRWKIPLSEITWEQIAAAQTGAPLTADVSAAGGSTIRPLSGWRVG